MRISPGRARRGASLISFVFVNYNLSEPLERCVRGLVSHVEGDFEIIVVDNASSDPYWPECRRFLELRSDTHVVSRQDNGGFGRACNEGARRASGDVLCFLNPDVVISNDFAQPIETWFAAHGDSAVVGIATNRGRWLDFSAGPVPGYLLEILSIFYVGRYLEALWLRVRTVLATGPFAVGWVMGACLFIRRDVFDALDGFDTDYFLYYEEVDLCHRVRETGARVHYDGSRSVAHEGSASSRRDYAAFTERFYVGKKRFFAKSRVGLSRRALLAIVQLQIHTQSLLWLVLGHLGSARAGAKRQGLAAAARIRFPG